MEENETVPKYSADICRDILNYTWNVSIEILKENDKKMGLTKFFKELRDKTNNYAEERTGLNNVLCIISELSDQLWRPAYHEQLEQGMIDVRTPVAPLDPGADLSTIALVRNDKPNYSKDHTAYISANLEKIKAHQKA